VQSGPSYRRSGRATDTQLLRSLGKGGSDGSPITGHRRGLLSIDTDDNPVTGPLEGSPVDRYGRYPGIVPLSSQNSLR
jgi:hypothetical protein